MFNRMGEVIFINRRQRIELDVPMYVSGSGRSMMGVVEWGFR